MSVAEVEFTGAWRFEDGTEILIRPIRPDDEPLMVQFHRTLSERSVYLRYFHMMDLDSRTSHERLRGICFIDHDRVMALVAERQDTQTGRREILAVGRLSKAEDSNEAEFALLISDEFQGHGLGTELLHRLIEVARAEHLDRVTADILPENDQMLRVCRLAGFRLRYSAEDHVIKAELAL